jgi:hypothetical protein
MRHIVSFLGLLTLPNSYFAHSSMSEGTYKELGDLLSSIAQRRHVYEPHAIAEHLKEAAGHEVSHHTLAEYLYGAHFPEPEFFCAFAQAFSLTVEERRNLAWTYIYGYFPP